MVKVRYRELSPELEKLATPLTSNNSRVSIGFDDEVGEFYYFSTNDLVPYHKQARTIFDEEEIQKLSETINLHGIRQPLSIIKSSLSPGKYEVISGERRLRAAKLAGLKKLPCIIIKDEKHADEISLIENIQRQDLHPLELARAINNLIEDNHYGSQTEVGKKIGLSRSQVSELLSLLSFSHEVQEELLNHSVRGREHFRKLHTLKSPMEQIDYIRAIKNVNPNGRNQDKIRNISKSIIRLSMIDGILKVQSYSLNKITSKEREDVKRALMDLLEQLEDKTVRGREQLVVTRLDNK